MSKFYFVRTVQVEGKNRLRALPFQKFDNGTAIVSDINVQADMERRKAFPYGTVFATDTLVDRQNGSSFFYAAGDIFPVSVAPKDIADESFIPTDEMMEAWTNFKLAHQELGSDENPVGVFAEDATAKELSKLEKIQHNPQFAKPTIKTDGYYIPDEVWWNAMMCCDNNVLQPIMFVGPAGSGKTEIAQLISKKYNLPCYIFDMGTMYDPVSEMLGVHRIGKNGTSVFEYADFANRIQQECVIVLDELSRATPTANNILLSVLDSRRTLNVEMAGEGQDRNIRVNPKCRFIATANVGAEYTGTFAMDIALQDRFEKIETDYMPADMEVDLLIKRCRIAMADAKNLVSVAQKVRKTSAEEELESNITTRDTLRAAKKVQFGFSAKDAMEMVYLPKFQGTKSDGARAIVWNTIISR